jgi:hypothetical protein
MPTKIVRGGVVVASIIAPEPEAQAQEEGSVGSTT